MYIWYSFEIGFSRETIIDPFYRLIKISRLYFCLEWKDINI